MDFTQSYATVNEGDDYFNNRLDNALWSDSTVDRKTKALRQATRIIDRLNFSGQKVLPTQILQFPRASVTYDANFEPTESDDTVVPDDIKIACFEIAWCLLDGKDIDEEIRNIQAKSRYMGVARTDYERGFVPEYLLAGIPSPTAWGYLKPYLNNPNEITLNRV